MELAVWLRDRGLLDWVLTQDLPPAMARLERVNGIEVHRVGLARLVDSIRAYLRPRELKRQSLTGYERELTRHSSRLLMLGHHVSQGLLRLFLLIEVLFFFLRNGRRANVVLCFSCSPLEVMAVTISRWLRKTCVVRASSSDLFVDLLWAWERRVLMKANAFVAISERIRAELEAQGARANKVHLIPNGVRVPDARWSPDDHHRYAAVCVANLSQQPLKGLDILLKAWATVLRVVPSSRLAIVGGGSAATLIAQARHLGIDTYVEFCGQTLNVVAVLLNAEVFVLPSRVEGMSNALLEAMALGMPCVATEISGSSDLIRSGWNGILVRPSDSGELAAALCELLRDSARLDQYGERARKTILLNYQLENNLERYRNLFRALTSEDMGDRNVAIQASS